MKIVKKVLIGLGIVLVLLIAAAVVLPIVFKDDIKAAIDRELANRINADVVFEADNFSLSFFRNFPSVTVQMKELGVFNRAPFEGVPLFVIQSLEVEVNLRDVLFGDQLRVKGITLVEPQILIKVLPDGKANYDIAIPSTDTVAVAAAEEATTFSFGIDHWEIVNGEVTYDDQSLQFFTALSGLNHSGSGNFNEKAFDLTTATTIDTLNLSFGGTEYISKKRIEVNATLGIEEDYTKYTFKENTAKINDFAMRFDGWFKMNPNDFGMDITFSSPENSFKSILSLVPGVYTQDFGSIETTGDLAFNGFVKGTYSDTQMPAFNLGLVVKDAMFKYPDLPTAIQNIQVDLLVDNATGVIENTLVDLKAMHLDFGKNPVDARLRIENLKDYRMDGNVAATLNLGELNKMFPIDGLDMRGTFALNATAKGVYDSLRKIIPAINASMALTNGYVQSKEFPVPLENVQVVAHVVNHSGNLAETTITVPTFSMMLDGQALEASATVQNLDDYTWDIKAKGGVDLEKITKIFPLDGMTLAGNVKADLQTKGKMSDVDAGRYDKLPTSGSASIRGFAYSSNALPYAVALSEADAVFDPKKIDLKKLQGTVGKTDFAVTGTVSNYIAYVLHNETIKGNVNFTSNLVDLNEFMTETEEETAAPTDSSTLRVIPIPKNIDFVLKSSVATVKMMDYTMTNASGDVILKEGIANLSNLKFNLLGGAFVVNGSYNANDLQHPKYDFGLKIDGMQIQQAANNFSVVKTYAPIAGLVNGAFGTDFKISGELKQDMMPDLATVNGSGLIKIAQAALTKSSLVSSVTSLTKLENTDQVTLRDVLMSASISNGKLSVKPFDVKFGNYVTNISGSTGLDGTIDYQLKMNVPAGKLGSQFQGFLAQYGGATNPNNEIPLTIGLGGTYANPKTTLLMSEQKEQVKQAVAQAAEEKGKEAVDKIMAGEKPKDVLNNLLKGGAKTDSTKAKDSTATKTDPAKQLQNKLNNLLKKKKN
ncbi:MAG: hypothetical protein MUC38_09495 [Cyclobacteriaceae bacterium]|jgi:hypothetical protein|nr:hypothetical protein [Cyclobacteriaceae bacterium]